MQSSPRRRKMGKLEFKERHMRNLLFLACAAALTLAVERIKGGFSGGTIASLMTGIDEAKSDKSRRRILGDA